MYRKLDEEYYVENPFLAHLQRLGWKVYRQNKDNPEDVKEILRFKPDLEPEYDKSIRFRESFREKELQKTILR
jgi:type I restriction enzyme R subunit